ncbi:hypothetical protein DL96DRAFT_1685583 [Flagelloscypha sp. PMI_526]|nr:hypothetical protein DL96DRAFT_1685583 [Flagelloscypha sp. PMI_526]
MSSPNPKSTSKFSPEPLPDAVEGLRQNFKDTIKAVAPVDALIAATIAQLVGSIPNQPSNGVSVSVLNALYFFSFVGIAMTVGASLSAMVFLDMIGVIPHTYHLQQMKKHNVPASNGEKSTAKSEHPEDESSNGFDILHHYGAPASMRWIYIHSVFSTVLGVGCLLLQLILLAWVLAEEMSEATFVSTTVVVVVGMIPLPVFFAGSWLRTFLDGHVPKGHANSSA